MNIKSTLAIAGIVFTFFSEVSLAEVYTISGSACQAITPGQAKRLNWGKEGLLNADQNSPWWVQCPVSRRALDVASGDFYEYFSAGMILSNGGDSAEAFTCILREYRANELTLTERQDPVLEAGSSMIIFWEGIEAADPATSSFNVSCKLPANGSVVSYTTESHHSKTPTLRDYY